MYIYIMYIYIMYIFYTLRIIIFRTKVKIIISVI